MRATVLFFIAAAACLGLFFSACSAPAGKDDGRNNGYFQFQGIILHENSVLVTKSKEPQLEEGQLISLSFPEETEASPVGSLFSYEIDDVLRESWPVQGSVVKAEEIKSLAGHTVISFDTCEAILLHLTDNTHFIDVRTAEEYEDGHISGAQNIPIDQIETDILSAVPEKSDIIILYCRSGNRSAQAGKLLEKLGYQVILDAGGIIDYKGEQVKGTDPGPPPAMSM